mmetsp:Transcript_1253/g.2380  ORF Transcript_1253/g.2380 Transcript_1253/m.2380 type:complete len:234 (-) Transcript_1253:962-1663(-)
MLPAWLRMRAAPGSRMPAIAFTLSAYLRVFMECSVFDPEGETHAIITVLLPPTNESFRTWVSLDARKGRCPFLSLIARMHSFRAKRDLLISAPSIRRRRSACAVSLPLSLPARSISENLPWRRLIRLPGTRRKIWKIPWLRELRALALVLPCLRTLFPWSMASRTSEAFFTLYSVSPLSPTFPFPSSSTISLFRLLSRSKMWPWYISKYDTEMLIWRLSGFSSCAKISLATIW